MDNFKKIWNGFEESTRKALCIGLTLIFVFSAGNILGALTNVSKNSNLQQTPSQTESQNAAETTQAPVTVAQTTTAAQQTESTTAPQGDLANSGGEYNTTEEIVALFNEASDKVKTQATKVVKNYENRSYDPNASVIPSALNSLADMLMETYLGNDTEPIEYSTTEDIIAHYPVPGETYSSKLTAADVSNATCVDNGTEYEITLNLNTNENPVQGSGVGAACDVLENSEVTSNAAVAAVLKSFNITYSNCVITCKIDKATKRVTHSNYVTPLTIDAVASVLVKTLDAKVVLSFEKDYTVTY